ncbi:MAG: nitrite reductase large subunit NirB [Steroidobacteraceae bacterium]
MSTHTKKLLVIGNGMVGHRLLESLVDTRADYEVTVLCEEPRPAYDRVQLSAYFSGKTAEDLSLVKEGFFTQHNIALHLNDKAENIDRTNKRVLSTQGRELSYDKLVLATGSYPFVPPVPGYDREHCLVYRTIEDLEAIAAAGKVSKTGVVVGGGLLGLECAKALKDLGVQTHVVEFAPRLMAVQLDDAGGLVLRKKIEELGVQVHTSKNTKEIIDGDPGENGARHRMVFADGSFLETDMIVFSAGIRPQDALAKSAGLEIGPRGGVVVNNHCQTSDADIYAIGECALWSGKIFGLVAPGYQMAQTVVNHLIGKDGAFTGADMSTKLKLMGVDVASLGDALCMSPGARAYSFVDERKQIYKKLVVSEDGTLLLGGILVGDATDYGNWLQMMLNALPLPEHPEELILPTIEGGKKPVALGVAALPNSAQICSCNNVSKGDLCAAIDAGCTTLGALKKTTKAGTSCGGCSTLVGQILNVELASRGHSVNNHLCEHFKYSRQELFHLVKVEKIKTFNDLIKKHGHGHGCDICKPTVGSIMASIYNEFVLQRDKAQLQDTNDYYLANMQKNGTYSIVPRIAGGELTPRQLITIGEVAEKFGLYTKITGGQRIDMFGAQVHELPLIWKELTDAGFESGHAYGKSLRTVKSCVGSTWCRYGVQDSVSLAIELENRYKGLRSPHKIKFAVSGCTRECAEAQSKDIGVIATEKGWSLYVCGNGGMKPRHGDLFVSDLDKATLIKYIDRVLMFYVRTADRLQRTSTWMENLEGGLDYLRQVVIDDKLNIGAELEADMALVVDTYECEWKKAINEPETLKRFRHFINNDSNDNRVVFVQERGQIRPATADELDRSANLSELQEAV